MTSLSLSAEVKDMELAATPRQAEFTSAAQVKSLGLPSGKPDGDGRRHALAGNLLS